MAKLSSTEILGTLTVTSDSTVKGNSIVNGNYTVDGNITVGGIVDGRDVATDGAKLDLVAANANLTGATVVSDIDFNITTDAEGHVTSCDITTVATRVLTLADLGYTGSVTANDYTHPSHPGSDIALANTALTGANIFSDIDITVTTDLEGHVTAASASTASRVLTLADLGYTGTTDANTYVHTTAGSAFTESGDTGLLSGATVISDLDFNITTDAEGHVTACDITTLSTRVLTLADLGYTGSATANDYTHPSHPGDDFSVDTGLLAGANVVSDIDINVTTDLSGHVTDTNGVISTRVLTLADLGYTGETNATADQSAAEILTAIKTVDGSGSGLDADKLDNIDSSQFLRSDVADVKTSGNLTFNDNVYCNFGTGNDFQIFCNGSHAYIDLEAGIGNLYIRDGSTTRFTFDDAGHFTATGNVTAYSDIRVKKNIEIIPNALDKVCQLNGYTFDRNDCDIPRQTGVIAQEVLEVLPEAIMADEEGNLSVAYGNIVGILIEAIKELKTEVEMLKGENQ
jgi:hypothetical protein